MVQITAAITLGLAGSAVGAPTVKRQGLWCPPGQKDCNGPIPAGDGSVLNSRRNVWCPPDQENCNGMPDVEPVPLPEPLPTDDDTIITNAKRTLTTLCDSSGLCDATNLPPVVARYIQEQPEKRQDITCMAVGCPKAANVEAEKRQDITCMGTDCPTPEGFKSNTNKRQDVACMSTECETPDSLKEDPDQEMTCMGLDCPKAKQTTTTTTTKRADNNIACMAVGCPKPAGLDTSVKRDVKAQEAALALRDHVAAVPKAARAAVTCMAIELCDPLPLPGNGSPMPTPQIKANGKRIVDPQVPYKGADAPLPWIDTLQESKKNKRTEMTPEEMFAEGFRQGVQGAKKREEEEDLSALTSWFMDKDGVFPSDEEKRGEDEELNALASFFSEHNNFGPSDEEKRGMDANKKRIVNDEFLEQISKPVPIADQQKSKRQITPEVAAALQEIKNDPETPEWYEGVPVKKRVTPQEWANGAHEALASLTERTTGDEILASIHGAMDDITKNKRVPPPDVLAAIEKYGSARPVTENRPSQQQDAKRNLPSTEFDLPQKVETPWKMETSY